MGYNRKTIIEVPKVEKRHTYTHEQPASSADELNDLAATGDAYLGSVTFMSEGDAAINKSKYQYLLGVQVPTLQKEGSHAQEPEP